jgi:hypothetical protein
MTTGPMEKGPDVSGVANGVSGTITVTFTGPERGFNALAKCRAPKIINPIVMNTPMIRGIKLERSFFVFMS